MARMTLEELKAQNAEESADTSEALETEQEETTTEEEFPVESEEEAPEIEHGVDEDDKTGDETEEVEAWMQSEEGVKAEKKYTGEDIGAAKAKVRAKLERKIDERDEEIARLNEQLKVAKPSDAQKPRREDYYDADDPDEAFAEALVDWRIKNQASQHAQHAEAEALKRQQAEAQAAISSEVDRHYERAVKLAADSGITPEAYQAADFNVRTMVDALTGSGDSVVDALIATVGEGSEKVFYNLGINADRRNTFKSLLENDPTGLKATAYLGRLAGELSQPLKRKTNAPEPAPNLKGGAPTGDKFKALKKRYAEAHRKGDRQSAFNIRREAKKAGADVTNW